MFVIESNPKSMAAEAYRTLRTNIQYASVDDEYRVISVTSSEPGEGKTTVAGNLALAIANGDSKVLLIDCDMRKPSTHKKFRLSNSVGLSDVLARKSNVEKALNYYNENLSIITAGKVPPNPSEMLSSNAMKLFLDEMKGHFDYIILDTPPLQAVTDAQVLAAKVDGTILVIKAKSTKKDTIKSSIDLIRNVNGNIIGTVLNGVDVPKSKYYNYYGM